MQRIRTVRRPRRPDGRIRRDPRAEKLGIDLLSTAEMLGPTGRPRRDPRAFLRVPVNPATGRRRIDRSRPLSASSGPTAPLRPAAEAKPRVRKVVIDDPAYWVLAVPDLEDGRLTGHDRDVLGGARTLADAAGGAVVVIDFGAQDDLGAAGADRVIRFDGQAFQGYAPEARVAAVMEVVRSLDPRHLVLPDTLTAGGDLGRRLAARLGETAAVQVQKVDRDKVIARGNGGRSDFIMSPPRLVLLAPEAADPVMGAEHEARAVEA
ncbi:MAG: electron transfer flavoprotein subunit alpha/FixB family protein, partial [Candidatus Competibacteraceae bacterium]|nr:electron transfer flavoprotein subunit alpha/FixB family protein [Candidatus Competibacteraceae bacterium]